MTRQNIINIALDIADYKGKIIPDKIIDQWEREILDHMRETVPRWSNDSRPAPQAHFRVNVSGLKRVPDATFTMDGDIRDLDMAEYWKQRDDFQREVDRRYPLETLAHFADLPSPDAAGE